MQFLKVFYARTSVLLLSEPNNLTSSKTSFQSADSKKYALASPLPRLNNSATNILVVWFGDARCHHEICGSLYLRFGAFWLCAFVQPMSRLQSLMALFLMRALNYQSSTRHRDDRQVGKSARAVGCGVLCSKDASSQEVNLVFVWQDYEKM